MLSIISSCNKAEEALSNDENIKHSAARETADAADRSDFQNLDNPMRDVIGYIKNGGRLPETKHMRDYISQMGTPKVVGNGSWPYGCANNLLVLGYPGATCGGGSTSFQGGTNANALDCPTYILDAFSNKIHALAMYGPDERQGYYVYLPDNVNANSKIVVLIHGGAWTTGPDPNQTNGWGSSFAASNPQQNNIVKNLLLQGYVVVAPLYRLVSYGDTPADFAANPISVTDQINDIDAAIQHVHANFPSCLGINANNIQVLGESAGGHLALMFAYTKANTSYIKSVVAVAAPTNLNQYFNFINSKTLIDASISQVCQTTTGNNFYVYNYSSTDVVHTKTHFPFYTYYDPTPDQPTLSITTYLNPQNYTCRIADMDTWGNFGILGWLPVPFSTAANNTDKRRLDLYNVAQSIVKQTVTNPATSTLFQNISPCLALTSARIIPTFILHGTIDELVVYTQATNTMDTRLANNGGLIGTYNSTNQNILGQNSPGPLLTSTIPTSYPSTGNKHIIKTYTNSGHVLYNPISSNSLVQPDILTWFNGH